MKKILMLCTLLAAGSWGMAAAASPEPYVAEETARKFYAWALTHKGVSLPLSEALQALQPMMTPQLMQLLNQARALEARCTKLTPTGDNLLVLEDSLLVDNYEETSEVVVGTPEVQGSRAEISALLFEIGEHLSVAHPYRVSNWGDKLELVNEGGEWQVADIVFTESHSLVRILTNYIAENHACFR